ncbi:response regulator [Daejeonella sp.]|uniref:response regulator n=1 Tax=Daejeonella sp. TaxID=2805397 RepID=UPI003982FF16
MRKQILIVDDELSIHKILNFILSADYDLVVKENGAEALSWLEDGNNPDLIISDLEMPYIDGESFIRNLKISGLFPNTPVILISSADNLEGIVQRMAYKADCFFKKPFNSAELKSCIIASLLNYDLTNP